MLSKHSSLSSQQFGGITVMLGGIFDSHSQSCQMKESNKSYLHPSHDRIYGKPAKACTLQKI
jgi:hypothetical protein